MTPNLEAALIVNMRSAMRRAESVFALEKLWADYLHQINECSADGQRVLHGLRARRSAELMG